jgi:transposase
MKETSPPLILEFDEKTPAFVLRDMLISSHRAALAFMEKNVLLEDENALLKRTLFGHSSEKRKSKKDQQSAPMLQVFDEAAVDDNAIDGELVTENEIFDNAVASNTSVPARDDKVSSVRPKRGRKPLPPHFVREDVIHDLPDSDKICVCGCQLSNSGEETSEQLELVPARLIVLRHVRLKYACKACTDGVKTAPMPKQPIPKGIPTAGLLAHVAVAKFDDHLPLYRQSEIWDRLGVHLPRSTLSTWILKMGDLLQPMLPLLQHHVTQSGYVNADETTTQVLKEPGRVPTSTSYMWVYMTGASVQPAIVYEYQPTRHGDHAKTFLNGFKGTLQTDGYSGCHAVTGSEGVMSAGCWAHARRKFHDVWVVLKKDGAASKALEIIGKLYDIERHMRDQTFTANQIKAYRQEMSKSILDAFHSWLISIKPKASPKSPLAKAITYTLNQWEPLTQYLENGDIAIDNNSAERQIRPFTIGRKNWLFMGSVEGEKAASVIYSLIETAKANGLNPEEYVSYVLKNIPVIAPDMIHTLLPWNVELPMAIELPASETNQIQHHL